MKFFKFTIACLFLLVFFSACRKDDLVIDEQPIPPVPTVKFEIKTTGEVYDLQGEAIKNATVRVNGQFTQTDDNGLFSITGLVDENKAVLSIEKDGYYSGHPVFYPEEGIGQHVKVQLMERLVSGTVTTSDKVIIVNQHKVDFTNASFKDASGNPYSGDVTVFATYLDPTDENLQQYMPGDLVGINTEDEERLLKSYGMLNVELEDNMGNPLNIDGEAEMTMQVPSELLGQAPATIPLWYFDEPTGNWMEEGEATLVGNQYVGTVTHFTLWNCDAPFRLVNISGSVNANLAYNSFFIKITRPNGDSNTTTLNEGGRFQGKVPENEVLTFEIMDNCGNVLLSETIGPFASDQNIGAFDVTGVGMTTITISGSAIDCNLAPITNGYAIVTDGAGNNHFLQFDANGAFSSTLAWCSGNAINITAFDSDAVKRSEKATFAFDSNITSNSMVTCEDVVPGIYISGPNVNKFIPAVGNFINGGGTNTVWEYQCIDDQGNGNKVLYDITVLSWTGDPNNPSMTHSFNGTPIGIPDAYSWGGNFNNPIIEIYTPTSGGLMDLEYEDMEITITPSQIQQNQITYTGHNVRVVGFVD